MANFSGGEAIGSGFRVIRRNPAAIAVWAAFYLVVGLLPSTFIQTSVGSFSPNPNPADYQAVFARMTRLAAWLPVLWGLGLFYSALAYSAVYRAVLDPEDRRYFYLRLTRRELYVGLTTFALALLFVVGIVVEVVAVFVIARAAPGLVTFLAICAAIAVTVWLALRFSMAPPMAYAQERFVLGESWGLTAGHGWKLFGVAFSLFVIVIGVEIVLLIPTAIVLSVTGAFSAMMATAQHGGGLTYPPAMIAAYLIVLPIFAALMYTILIAPWANIYQQLTGPKAGAAP